MVLRSSHHLPKCMNCFIHFSPPELKLVYPKFDRFLRIVSSLCELFQLWVYRRQFARSPLDFVRIEIVLHTTQREDCGAGPIAVFKRYDYISAGGEMCGERRVGGATASESMGEDGERPFIGMCGREEGCVWIGWDLELSVE